MNNHPQIDEYSPQIDDDILRNLLYRTDIADPGAGSDEADELFALLIEGKLNHDDREHLLRCLDKNPEARQMVGQYLERASELPSPGAVPSSPCVAEPSGLWQRLAVGWKRWGELSLGMPRSKLHDSTTRPPQPGQPTSRASAWSMPYYWQTAIAVAALLLVATVSIVWFARKSFMDGPVLAMRGSLNLMHLGYTADPELGGEMGDNSQQTLDLQRFLESVPEDEAGNQLQEAYGLLFRNLAPEARAVFEQVLLTHPDSYYGLLGQGMAFYMEHQYESAEAAFRSAAQEHPDLAGAKINLAMTLAQLGRDDEALNKWRAVAAEGLDHLPADQQQAIAAEITRLETALSNQGGGR
jgi:tetratricopeptide (TPR) repeat protein